MLKQAKATTLVLTVGTGDRDRLEATLIAPIKKSIAHGVWKRIVFLPSKETAKNAEFIRTSFPSLDAAVIPLKKAGDENDPDVCYRHFSDVLESEIRQVGADRVVVDFTRGTKAMSAAIVAAAIRHGVTNVRYMYSEQRDARGVAISGDEKVGEFDVAEPLAHRRLDRLIALIKLCDFAGAKSILLDPSASGKSTTIRDITRWTTNVIDFYSAWDGFAYRDAPAAIGQPSQTAPDQLKRLAPTADEIAWVKLLASGSSDPVLRRRALSVDIYANGLRRKAAGRYEEALVWAYRVLELITQVRLFEKDYNPDKLNENDIAVRAALDRQSCINHSKQPFKRGRKISGGLQLNALILKELSDPLADRILDLQSWRGPLSFSKRNASVLIHGFSTLSGSAKQELDERYGQLGILLGEDAGAKEYAKMIRTAQFERRLNDRL